MVQWLLLCLLLAFHQRFCDSGSNRIPNVIQTSCTDQSVSCLFLAQVFLHLIEWGICSKCNLRDWMLPAHEGGMFKLIFKKSIGFRMLTVLSNNIYTARDKQNLNLPCIHCLDLVTSSKLQRCRFLQVSSPYIMLIFAFIESRDWSSPGYYTTIIGKQSVACDWKINPWSRSKEWNALYQRKQLQERLLFSIDLLS